MTKKHTQTPWHIGAGNGEDAIFAESGRMRLEAGGTTLYPVCTVVRGWDEAEDQANARLIAAAPELLEAARLANLELIALGIGSSGSPALRALWWAIAKAEGKEAVTHGPDTVDDYPTETRREAAAAAAAVMQRRKEEAAQ